MSCNWKDCVISHSLQPILARSSIKVRLVPDLIKGSLSPVINKCSKPTIARIRGYCIGGGLAVSLLCDIRIASDVSKFGVPAARLGLGYRASGLKIKLFLTTWENPQPNKVIRTIDYVMTGDRQHTGAAPFCVAISAGE